MYTIRSTTLGITLFLAACGEQGLGGPRDAAAPDDAEIAQRSDAGARGPDPDSGPGPMPLTGWPDAFIPPPSPGLLSCFVSSQADSRSQQVLYTWEPQLRRLGRRQVVSSLQGQTYFEVYDTLDDDDRVVGSLRVSDGVEESTVRWELDENGHPVSVIYSDGATTRFTNTYDSQGRLVARQAGDQSPLTFHYGPLGYVDEIVSSSTSKTTFEYDQSGRLTAQKLFDEFGLRMESEFRYDATGNLIYVGVDGGSGFASPADGAIDAEAQWHYEDGLITSSSATGSAGDVGLPPRTFRFSGDCDRMRHRWPWVVQQPRPNPYLRFEYQTELFQDW